MIRHLHACEAANMAGADFNWPKEGDMAFKPSVSSADQGRLDAFVMPSEETYIVGFQRAADMIVAAAQADDLNPDNLFFPVAYLYRHHLELMLKEFIGLGGAIEVPRDSQSEPCPSCGHRKKPKDLQSEHNLHRLWNKVNQLLNTVWPDSPDADLKAVERVILEFHKLDRTGQAFRYPRDKQGAPHLQAAPPRVDLANMMETVDAVSKFLEAAYTGIDSCDPGPP